jgi:hypothetical protein
MIKSIASLTGRDLYNQAMPFACGSSFGDLGQLFKAFNSSPQVISREFVTLEAHIYLFSLSAEI